ncbi:MAG: PAS domain S-box protein [Desulfomonile tiedjei]|nr:PAS domain S-box protein [Desulfomonile tiedjei]
MRDDFATTRELADELMDLRARIAELEAWKAEHRWDAKALRESEAKFRNLTEKSVVGVFLIRGGVFRYVNPKMADIFGYTVDELIDTREVRTIVFGDDWPRVDRSLNDPASVQGRSFNHQFRGIRKDGEVVHIEVYATGMDYGGEATLIGTLVDVTKRVRAEADLATELRKFQALYDLAVAMTSERSLDENLLLVVEKSRVLLQGDSSYIALCDKTRGDVYMHSLVGINTEAFKKMRLPFGAGLGGKVAVTGRPRIVDNYFEEVDSTVHPIVRAEGLISGVAVPIQMGETNLGVLYVFNRTRTTFTRSDVDALSLLGNLAAVEIARRRTEEELLGARAELEMRVGERTAELRQANERLQIEVAQRVRADQELRESEERYRTLVEESFDGILVHKGGAIIFANASLYRMLGYEIDELQGKDAWSICHPEDRTIAKKLALARMRGEKVPAQYEMRLIRRDGSVFDVEINARLVEFGGGRAVQVCVRDITERKRAAEALRASEEKYRLVVENASDAILVIQDGMLKFVNPKAKEILGYTEEELMSRPLQVFLHPDDRQIAWTRYRKRLQGEPVPRDYPLRILDRDGNIRWLEVNAVLIDWGGRPATLNFASDITAKRKTEQELIKIEKLESLGILAGGIAHDFNNIMTAILGNISVAKMCLGDDGKVVTRLSDAEKACLHAQGLTQQLLTFAKGGTPIRKLATVGDMIRDACQFALMGSNIKCDFSFPDDLWAVEVDGGQINQVFYNLVINAHHAMPAGGTIQVSASNAAVTPADGLLLEAGNYVKIVVKDHGSGIPKKYLTKIFDPYFTTKNRGSGLGLATSFSIVKNHGGLITVDSDIGVGAAFSIYLPASRQPRPAVKDLEAPISAGSGKILIMDDEALIRDLVQEMLSLLGYEVVVARDGVEAIEQYRIAREAARPFDVVVMDLTVPGGLGGGETIRKLRQIDPQIRAIVSSGYSNDPIMADYANYGFCGVVAKPYGVKELSEMIRRTVRDGKPNPG